MLNGAVCFTDWSRYLTEELEDGSDVIFYELDQLDKLPEQVNALLKDRERWEQIQKRAYQTASEKHRWEHRAKRIHEEILCKM
jgi:spore maturation protein CgeB